MRRMTPGLFDPPTSRPEGAQPLVTIDDHGRPFYSPLFVNLSAEDQAAVRAQGEALARQWAERQERFSKHLPDRTNVPRAPADELTEAIGEVAAALLAVHEPLNRLAGALRSYDTSSSSAP